jgi:hypothetical protein
MASRRLLDLFAIANASAAVARKHFLIRSHQLTHYAATSSILNARRQQQQQPPPQKDYSPGETTTRPPVPAVETPQPPPQPKEGIAQDHHFFPGEGTTAAAKDLQHQYEHTIPSETADPPVIPDETLAQGINGETFYSRPEETSDVASNLPRVKIPRESVGEQFGANVEGDLGTKVVDDTMAENRMEEKDKELEELGAQLFQSRRARSLFGVKPKLQGMTGPAARYRAAAENGRAQAAQMARVESHLRAVEEETKKKLEEDAKQEIELEVAEEARREQIKVADDDIKEIAAEISHGVKEYEKVRFVTT